MSEDVVPVRDGTGRGTSQRKVRKLGGLGRVESDVMRFFGEY